MNADKTNKDHIRRCSINPLSRRERAGEREQVKLMILKDALILSFSLGEKGRCVYTVMPNR